MKQFWQYTQQGYVNMSLMKSICPVMVTEGHWEIEIGNDYVYDNTFKSKEDAMERIDTIINNINTWQGAIEVK